MSVQTPSWPFVGGWVNPPASAGDAVSIYGQKDSLEKEIAVYSSILAWEITWTEEPGGLSSSD